MSNYWGELERRIAEFGSLAMKILPISSEIREGYNGNTSQVTLELAFGFTEEEEPQRNAISRSPE